jgi:hypothetical protein
MPRAYAARCLLTYCCKASFMRVCQPSPVDLKYSTTSGLYRTVTATFVGSFCGPRWPGRRILALAQYSSTASASLGSYGHSESLTFSGAAARAAAICSLLKAEGFEVRARFMLVTVTAGNHSGAVLALRPNQEDNPIAKPPQASQPRFAILLAFVFHCDHRGVEYTIHFGQIDAVRPEILPALALIPRDRWLIVVTQNS